MTRKPVIFVTEPTIPVALDRAGYFVITPSKERGLITVEHYAYDDTLLHTIAGETARALYMTIVDADWVTELSHAAYLGKELTRAELSLSSPEPYVQDRA